MTLLGLFWSCYELELMRRTHEIDAKYNVFNPLHRNVKLADCQEIPEKVQADPACDTTRRRFLVCRQVGGSIC